MASRTRTTCSSVVVLVDDGSAEGEEMEDLQDLNTFPRAIARLVADGTK